MNTFFTSLAAIFLAGSAHAATMITETTDFTNQDLLAGPLSITSDDDFSTAMAYSISGSLSSSDPSDTFTLVLGPDRIIENIFVTFSNVGGSFAGTPLSPSEVATLSAFSVYTPNAGTGDPQVIGFTTFPSTGNSQTDFMGAIDSIPDDQTWVFGFGIDPAQGSLGAAFGTISGDWNVTFDVVDTSLPSQVPLPASSLLLVGALAGFGFARKRSKTAS